LNIQKTVIVPLWRHGIEHVHVWIGTGIPEWADIRVDDHGTYLGFVIGPGKGTKSWEKPLKKYIDRVQRWSVIGGGMQLAATA
jgi:hypothetical protein